VEKVSESRFMRRANKCPRSGRVQPLSREQAMRRSLRCVLSALTFALCCSLVLAQQPRASEYQVKAAYLLNFGKFVKWPSSASADKSQSFAACVLGADPFGVTLDSTLAGETLDNKPVVIKRIAKPQDAAACRILFISSTEEKHLKEILAAIDQASVLTVSDMPGFSKRGGMIEFVLDGSRVRFEINLASAENAKLNLSSELLKVATTVRRNAGSGD
jgi:hypothetical protein